MLLSFLSASSKARAQPRLIICRSCTPHIQLFLGFSVVVQLAALIIPAAAALWIDQLTNTWLAHVVRPAEMGMYKGFFAVMTTVRTTLPY